MLESTLALALPCCGQYKEVALLLRVVYRFHYLCNVLLQCGDLLSLFLCHFPLSSSTVNVMINYIKYTILLYHTHTHTRTDTST